MKKFLICLIIFISVFIGTTTCVVLNGYHNYQLNKENESSVTKQGPDNSFLTSLASNVLGLSQFGGKFSLTDNDSINLEGTFAIENKETQTIDLAINGYCGSFYVDADLQYLNNTIYIDLNNTKIKLTTDDIQSVINAISSTIESESAIALPKLDTNVLMGFLDKMKITETTSGKLIELAIPELCNLYLSINNDSLPTQILVNNIKVGENLFTLNVKCNQTQKINKINPEEYLSISPALEYIQPTLITLNENNLGISGQIIINGQTFYISSAIKDKSSVSGKVRYGNIDINYQLKNNYVLVELFDKVFKITLDDVKELLNSLTAQTSKNATTKFNIEKEFEKIDLTPTLSKGKLSSIELKSDNIYASFDIAKSYLGSITINESNTKSINDLVQLINNYKSILSNEYSLNINLNQNDININGSLYLSHDNLNINKTYFSGKIQDTPVKLFYQDNTAYCDLNNIKFKLSGQSINNILSIITTYISGSNTSIDLSSLANLKFINDIDFTGRTITYKSQDINAQITSFSGFFKANISANATQISATIYADDTYKYLSKKLIKSEYKNYSEISDLLEATIKTFEGNIVEYSGNISLDIFDTTIKSVGLNIRIDRNQKQIDIKLSNLPNNAILTYLSSIHYVGQECNLTITKNGVRIYTTTKVRLTGKQIVLADKTVPLNEFSVDNLYDIMSLRKVYINQLNNASNNTKNPKVDISTDMLDINKDETILTLTEFVKKFASELKIEITHKNTIETIQGRLNIHNLIKFNLNLTEK